MRYSCCFEWGITVLSITPIKKLYFTEGNVHCLSYFASRITVLNFPSADVLICFPNEFEYVSLKYDWRTEICISIIPKFHYKYYKWFDTIAVKNNFTKLYYNKYCSVYYSTYYIIVSNYTIKSISCTNKTKFSQLVDKFVYYFKLIYKVQEIGMISCEIELRCF